MRPERYNVRESEAKWRKAWADAGIFTTSNDDPRPKYYVLDRSANACDRCLA